MLKCCASEKGEMIRNAKHVSPAISTSMGNLSTPAKSTPEMERSSIYHSAARSSEPHRLINPHHYPSCTLSAVVKRKLLMVMFRRCRCQTNVGNNLVNNRMEEAKTFIDLFHQMFIRRPRVSTDAFCSCLSEGKSVISPR